MKEISILIGGKAGDGIKEAGRLIARLLNRLGYRIFLYDEYPSLVKGGHNFNVIRGSDKKIRAHKKNLDIIVALNQETVEKQTDLNLKIAQKAYDKVKKPRFEERLLASKIMLKTKPKDIGPVLAKQI